MAFTSGMLKDSNSNMVENDFSTIQKITKMDMEDLECSKEEVMSSPKR